MVLLAYQLGFIGLMFGVSWCLTQLVKPRSRAVIEKRIHTDLRLEVPGPQLLPLPNTKVSGVLRLTCSCTASSSAAFDDWHDSLDEVLCRSCGATFSSSDLNVALQSVRKRTQEHFRRVAELS